MSEQERMREIKFRAWIRQERKMYEVNTIFLNAQYGMAPSDCAHMVDLYSKSRAYYVGREVDLMEFTGFKKHGRRVYEDDILRWDGDKEHPAQVFWDKNQGAWMVKIEARGDTYYDKTEMLSDIIPFSDVIGNIHENPELVTEGETDDE